MIGDTAASAASDPSDLLDLWNQTARAIHDLTRLDLHGPDTEAARQAVRLTRLTLECFWLPAIDAELHDAHAGASDRSG